MTTNHMSVVISETLIRRLVKDIKYLQRNPLDSHGIYYRHDEDDLLIGYALIIGAPNTPYYGGNYFFKFKFTTNYPYESPIVEFCTNNGMVRFHPNFYKNGKICISLLNTWAGEQWTSCQNISSILLTLCSLMDENPILHEPCISLQNVELRAYNDAIYYYNLSVAICDVLEQEPNTFVLFFESEIKTHFVNHVDNYLHFVEQKVQSGYKKEYVIQCYEMNVVLDYESLLSRLNILKTKMKRT